MKSEKSYRKFQKFYEILIPVIGLSALYAWDGAVELKIVLTIILLRTCYSWSERAALEKGAVDRFKQLRIKLENAAMESTDNEEPEGVSWVEFIGLFFQIAVTILIALLISKLLG
ncbi:MAG: hypothetical protein ACLFV2_05295 [Desulfurivibrionaceae bacterium]